jgi:uncharacterized repeat protein (TIGR01451 family)
MKTLRKLSLPLQGIGITAVLLLLTQSAFALGTDEDTDINNRASVDYAVGGVGQLVIESAPGAGNSTPGATLGTDTVFEVDRLIDFEVTGPAGNTIIAPGQLDAVLVFTMTNSGNDHQDFGFVVTNLAGPDFDMNAGTLQVFVDAAPFDGVYVAVDDTATFVDELVPDGVTTATIFVVADADSPIPVDGDLADMQLEARAYDGNDGVIGAQGGLAADHSGDVDVVGTVQNVFGELGLVNFDNRFEATGTYEVQAATLTVSKASAVISDPFSVAPNWKAIPGAVVEYTVTIVNNGSVVADNVSVSDTIQIANVTFNDADPYGTLDAEITVNAVVDPDLCEADLIAGDGCTYDVGTGALLIGTTGGLSIPAAGTATITYQVTIN